MPKNKQPTPVWVLEFKKVVCEIQGLAAAESCANKLTLILVACQRAGWKEAQKLAQESWSHLDLWFHGLESSWLTREDLDLKTRKRMMRVAHLIEQAQDFLIQRLEVRPEGGLSDAAIIALYTPKPPGK